jgi:hypothetical protein
MIECSDLDQQIGVLQFGPGHVVCHRARLAHRHRAHRLAAHLFEFLFLNFKRAFSFLRFYLTILSFFLELWKKQNPASPGLGCLAKSNSQSFPSYHPSTYAAKGQYCLFYFCIVY